MKTLLLAFRNLFRNTRRTLAILLTVGLGAGALFAFQGFIEGVLKDYRHSTIHAHYGNGQISTKGYRGKVYQEPWKHWIKNPKNLKRYLRSIDGVDYIFPRVTFSALLANGKVTANGQGEGIDARTEAKFFHSLNVEKGRMLSTQKDGILLGKGLAEALGVKPRDKVTVMTKATDEKMNKVDLIVTGIFHTGAVEFDSRVFRIQIKQAQSLLKTKSIESVSLGLNTHDDWERIAQEITDRYPRLDVTPFNILDEVYYQHSVDWLNAQFAIVQIIILSIVLLGIFNTISASILERKQEIGNFRANGESVFSIMELIISEGFLLGLLGSAIGLGITYGVVMGFLNEGILMPAGPGLTKQFYIKFSFDQQMVVSTMALSTISALVAATLAGIRVAKMPIAKALRSY